MSNKGIAIVFGLVVDPKDAWGVGIIDVVDEVAASTIGANDPPVKAGLGFEIYPTPGAIIREWYKKYDVLNHFFPD